MKLLVDMNLSPRWIEFLNTHGLEAVHWSDVGAANASDSELMRFAAEHSYTVLTYDLDFSSILAVTHGNKPSVVQLRLDNLSMSLAGPVVVSAIEQMHDQLETGALLTVDLYRTRVRLLPVPPVEKNP
jgi:predicted nuclease of predicted toxin-antitoxin system